MIRLQFVCSNARSSRFIAWFSQGHFSHVDAIMPNGDLLGARYDPVGDIPAGVQIRPPDYAEFAKRVVMSIPTTAEQARDFYKFLRVQIGKPYDTMALLGFLFNRNWREDESWICSELQTAAGIAAGILPELYVAASKITPASCALVYSAIGGMATD